MKQKNFPSKSIYFFFSGLFTFYFVLISRAGVYDWEKEIFYLQYIKESLLRFRSLPYFLWNTNGLVNYPLLAQNGLFIGNPETLLFSPWIFLSAFLKPVAFIKLFYLVHFALAIIGIILLSRRLGWSDRQIRLFSGLFLLSPIILQHLAIGYTPWINLFFLPLFMYFLLVNQRSLSIIGSAMVVSLVILQGGIHVALWLLIFLALKNISQALLDKKGTPLLDLLSTFGLTGLLTFARLYASFQALHDFGQRTFPGFTARAFLKMALELPLFFGGDIDDIERYFEFKIDGIPYWDAGVYWGPFVVLILVSVVLLTIKFLEREKRGAHRDFLPILFSSLGLWLLSFGSLYSTLAAFLSKATGIPAFEGVEKYPFRFSLMAYYGLSLWFASSGLQLLQEMHFPFNKISIDSLPTAVSTAARRLTSKILPGILSLLCLGLAAWFALGKKILVDEIGKAYFGSGQPLIEKLMAHQTDLPLEAYLQKLDALSGKVSAAVLTAIAVGLIVLINLRFPGLINRGITSIFHWFSQQRMILIELLLILPLFIASLSWVRVATATPEERFERELILAPELTLISPAGALIEISDLTPSRMQITCNASGGNACKFELPIKESDLEFFKILPDPLARNNQGDSQVFTIEPQITYSFQIKTHPFELSVLFTLFNWLCASTALIYFGHRIKRASS